MKASYEVLKSLLRTEKSSQHLLPLNKYIFWVARNANKIEIKSAVEEIYKVKVKSVNTITSRGKIRRVRFQIGKTPDWKKAVVTLQEGHKIDIT